RPSLARRLSVPPRPGLAEYLAGRADPQEILQTVAVPAPGTANGNGNGHATGNGNGNGHGAEHHTENGAAAVNLLVCISAGAPTTGAAELLASPRMRELMREVTEVYDLVLVDTAPLLP